MIKPGVYRHFKGKRYRVLFEAVNSETGSGWWYILRSTVRAGCGPASMWEEQVEADGVTQPRFAFESD